MRHRNTAFTLVELLVVIGIISVLIAILLPALNKARAAAQAVTCASNHRQLVMGLRMYAEEHKGFFPPVYPLYQSVTVGPYTRTAARVVWYGWPLVGPYIGNRSASSSAFPPSYQSPTTDIVSCPTVRATMRHYFDTGIGYNNSRQNEINRTDLTIPGIGRIRKLGSFRSAYKVMLTVDTTSTSGSTFSWERYYFSQGWPISGNDNAGTGYPAYRHNGAVTVGFADGHVDFIKSNHPDDPNDVTSGLYRAYLNKQVTHRAGGPD